MNRWFWAAVTAAVILYGLFFWHTTSWAHEAPSGWSYGWECCSGLDCSQVEDDKSIHATAAGWLIDETGETIPYGDPKIKKSGDEHFHRCLMEANKPLSKTRCLYVPPQGS